MIIKMKVLKKFDVVQDGNAYHPLYEIEDVEDMIEQLMAWQYEFDDYKINLVHQYKSFGYGAYNEWWEIQGELR